MIKLGLVSITFRQLTCEEVIGLVKDAGLDCIEWGGDIHVPHGDTEKARYVKKLMDENGLTVAGYGSYYRAGADGNPNFEDVLSSAKELGAPVIRVWAGKLGNAESNEQNWQNVVSDSRRIASMAEKENIKISYEFHDDTLTDDTDKALALLKEVNHPNLSTYWQPPHHLNFEERRETLLRVLPHLTNIHVFSWTQNSDRSITRNPLAHKEQDWSEYLRIAAEDSRMHYCMLEFVNSDDVENFKKDAETLKKLV